MRGFYHTILEGNPLLPAMPDGTSLELWIDVNDFDQIVFSSGSLVSQINDKSGNARHGINQVSQGTWTAGQVNGKPAIILPNLGYYEFGALGDFNFLHNKTACSIYIVFKPVVYSSDITTPSVLKTTNGGSTNGIIINTSSFFATSKSLVVNKRAQASGGTFTMTPSASTGFVQHATYNKIRDVIRGNGVAGSDYELFANNNLISSVETLHSGSIGAGNHSFKLRVGDEVSIGIAELIIYKHLSPTTPDQIDSFDTDMNTYFINKYNL